ncbi:NACHT domain-containing protein [Kribbella steppae]|uniref:NACHT domain-containing protein n=1 Tax=Kribbella steppae TaxID=2512223 RepID=A0A4R2HPH4_9ACTN|nr:NACHT domain-containing protein [Kribbella steppae]TCO33064.1 NACHT domain-containing protein [Kribbella steppae]
MEFGDVDPLSAAIGFAALLVAIPGMVVVMRGWRRQHLDTAVLTEQLAGEVGKREDRARLQLLGDPSRTIDLRFDFRPAPAHNAAGAAPKSRLGEVAAYYWELQPRRMVITGAPGAGKTVLAIELIMALLANRMPGDPVPIRLTASSWDLNAGPSMQPSAATQQMKNWVTAHLVEAYRLPQRAAQALVDAGRVLPVVDGLDELDPTDRPGYASRAGQALQVFNSYQRYSNRAELIVTCRSGHYQALTDDLAWVQDAARVEIRPVSGVQARKFITARAVDAKRWQTVLETIKRGHPLTFGLDTPWRLALALTVYEQRDKKTGRFLRNPDELTNTRLGTSDAVRDHLLESFIPAAFRNAGDQSLDPAQAHRWLAVIASYLNHNTTSGRGVGGRQLSGTDIVLHELWPLAGVRRPRMVFPALLAVAWLVGFPIMLSPLSTEFSADLVLALGLPFLIAFLLGCLSYSEIWPKPHRLVLTRLHTAHGRREFAVGLAVGLVAGLVAGLVLGLVAGVGLAGGLAGGLIWGLVLGLEEEADLGTPEPRSMVRDDLVIGLVLGLAFTTAIVIAIADWTGLGWFALGVAVGTGLAGGLTFGLAGWRYVALLLCTRRRGEHWLPWRLGQFLDACYRAGIVRIASTGYQFRHRELQDYLAHHPLPAADPSSDGIQTGGQSSHH